MIWKIAILTLFLPLFVSATETELKQNSTNKALKNEITNVVNQYAKPGAPVDLSYTVPKQKSAGNTFEVELIFKTQVNEGELNVKIEVNNDLIINDLASSDFNIILDENATTYPASIAVTSAIEGLFYINIFTSMNINGNTMNRTFSIPVKVGRGNAKLKKTGNLSADKHGKKIMIMRAKEVIK